MADKLGRVAGKRPHVHSTLLVFLCLLPTSASAQSATDRAQAGAVAEYVVQAGDVLSVLIWGWPTQTDKLEGKFPVESSGKAFLPVIGAVDVAGKTTERVQTEVRQRLAAEQNQAVVIIEPLFAVGVNGEVRSPNVYDFKPGQTLFDAISRAGGYAQNANRSSVLLVRNGSSQEIEAGSPSELAARLSQEPLESGDRLLVHPSKRVAWPLILNVLQVLLTTATFYTMVTK